MCEHQQCAACLGQTPEFDPSDRRSACIWRARELGAQYLLDYVGCAHSSFAATFDALREYGIEFFPKQVQDEVFKGIIGLTGGAGNMNEGTCGAVFGASFAIAVVTGQGRAQSAGDGGRHTWVASAYIKDSVARLFLDQFGSIVCRDILYQRWGAAFASQYPGRSKDFFAYSKGESCRNATECIIAQAAGCAAQVIWDYVHGQGLEEEAIWQAHQPSVEL